MPQSIIISGYIEVLNHYGGDGGLLNKHQVRNSRASAIRERWFVIEVAACIYDLFFFLLFKMQGWDSWIEIMSITSVGPSWPAKPWMWSQHYLKSTFYRIIKLIINLTVLHPLGRIGSIVAYYRSVFFPHLYFTWWVFSCSLKSASQGCRIAIKGYCP